MIRRIKRMHEMAYFLHPEGSADRLLVCERKSVSSVANHAFQDMVHRVIFEGMFLFNFDIVQFSLISSASLRLACLQDSMPMVQRLRQLLVIAISI